MPAGIVHSNIFCCPLTSVISTNGWDHDAPLWNQTVDLKLADGNHFVISNPWDENNENMAITPKGLKYLLVGLIVMISGYILMTGGGSDDPQVFNYAMFDFRRMVAAPVVIILGIVIEVVAIMGMFGKGKKEE